MNKTTSTLFFITLFGCLYLYQHLQHSAVYPQTDTDVDVDVKQEIRLNSNESRYYQCTEEESKTYPHHCHLMDIVATDPEKSSKELHDFAKRAGFVLNGFQKHTPMTIAEAEADDVSSESRNLFRATDKKDPLSTLAAAAASTSSSQLPSVLAHGMGDSCFNGGMKSITSKVSTMTNSYATCIPTGDNQHDDTINGYFLSMDASIEIFANKVKADPKLQNGFNAVGFSQGNNVIRGYIARHNDPPVNTFISVNGVNGGVGAVPYCMPPAKVGVEGEEESLSSLHSSKICNALMEIMSNRAYSDFGQKHSFQANYWRDPRKSEKERYSKFSQLAQLNNEGLSTNTTLNENWAKTNHFVWVMATEDRVVWPAEGEQWGAPNPNADDPFTDILPMNETEWYVEDLFGLRTAQENGKNYFESFVGNHLEFTMEEFESWVNKYFKL